MKSVFRLYIIATCLLYILFQGCKGRKNNNSQNAPSFNTTDTQSYRSISDTLQNKGIIKKDTVFYGDTVWINPYGSQEWLDTISTDDYVVTVSVKVDTTDYIIDTVKTAKGNRIVIGYNHNYMLQFFRKSKPWFTLLLDKKNGMENVLRNTDYWLESNLDVFQNLVYNEKYHMFIIEFDINPRYNYGSVYYIVFDTKGIVQHIGNASSWGGGGPDGKSFLTQNGKMYVTCHEIFNFSKMTSESIAQYAIDSDVLHEIELSGTDYKQVHAIRDLSDNIFLVIFHKNKNQPQFNAIILNTDSIILDRFSYEGIMEEMDALLLFYEDTSNNRYYIHDVARDVLVSLETQDSVSIKQIPESAMKYLPEDSLIPESYYAIVFESFGSKIFYVSKTNSCVFYRKEIE